MKRTRPCNVLPFRTVAAFAGLLDELLSTVLLEGILRMLSEGFLSLLESLLIMLVKLFFRSLVEGLSRSFTPKHGSFPVAPASLLSAQ